MEQYIYIPYSFPSGYKLNNLSETSINILGTGSSFDICGDFKLSVIESFVFEFKFSVFDTPNKKSFFLDLNNIESDEDLPIV